MRAIARLSGMRRRAESLMVDTCIVDRRTGSSTIDEETGAIVYTYAPVYSGPCRVQIRQTIPTEPFAGEAGVTVQQQELHLPVATSGAVLVGDRVTITASTYDAALVGRVLRIQSDFSKSLGTARRFGVEVLTG